MLLAGYAESRSILVAWPICVGFMVVMSSTTFSTAASDGWSVSVSLFHFIVSTMLTCSFPRGIVDCQISSAYSRLMSHEEDDSPEGAPPPPPAPKRKRERSSFDPFGFFRRRRGEEESDKPHRITIALGLLSPALALAAFGLAWNNRQLSIQSMEISQRAYLTAENGSWELLSGQFGDLERWFVSSSIAFDVKNSGDTPATLVSAEVELHKPEGWAKPIRDSEIGTYAPENGAIDRETIEVGQHVAARSSIPVKIRLHQAFHVTKDAFEKFNTAAMPGTPSNQRYFLCMTIRIKYRDVFGKLHPMEWGWIPRWEPMNGPPVVEDCQTNGPS